MVSCVNVFAGIVDNKDYPHKKDLQDPRPINYTIQQKLTLSVTQQTREPSISDKKFSPQRYSTEAQTQTFNVVNSMSSETPNPISMHSENLTAVTQSSYNSNVSPPVQVWGIFDGNQGLFLAVCIMLKKLIKLNNYSIILLENSLITCWASKEDIWEGEELSSSSSSSTSWWIRGLEGKL